MPIRRIGKRRGLPDKELKKARLRHAAPSVRLCRTAPPEGEHTRKRSSTTDGAAVVVSWAIAADVRSTF